MASGLHVELCVAGDGAEVAGGGGGVRTVVWELQGGKNIVYRVG
jgi:hypothetical protein